MDKLTLITALLDKVRELDNHAGLLIGIVVHDPKAGSELALRFPPRCPVGDVALACAQLTAAAMGKIAE